MHFELNDLCAAALLLPLGPTLVDRKLAEFGYKVVIRVRDESVKLFLCEIVMAFIGGIVVPWRRRAMVAWRRSATVA
jgi:hypothetical protein